MRRAQRAPGDSRRGLALIIVLIVLLVLLVMATPFLLMARNADSASNELSDRVESRIALDTAGRHLRAVLQEGHAATDRTPYWDALDEIEVSNDFDPRFLVAADPQGAMWDAEVRDIAGLIDLNSCSPHVIANLMGVAKRFTEAVTVESRVLKLNSAEGLRPEGFLWCEGELIRYTKLEGSEVVQFTRGVLGPPQGGEWHGGPRPPMEHVLGSFALDQRAFAPALWRTAGPDGWRPYEAVEELALANEFELGAVLAASQGAQAAADARTYEALYRHTSVHAGLGAGVAWQHATRVSSPIQGGRDGILRVESLRWINPGCTVRIRDGTLHEYALVQKVERTGEVVLDKVLVNDFQAFRAELDVLVRRPVNLNTASPEVLEALFTNLQISGRNSRILRDEAVTLARIVVQSRPLEGFEDFLRRVVLPAAGLEKLPGDAPGVPEDLVAGSGFLAADKALALYRNGLNANDGSLAFATMPYCFTSRDVYAFELRASINAASGVERSSRVRDEVAVIVPQRELLKLWARQEDFDEALRLGCDAPWWMTGPNATSRWDSGASPPSRTWAHMGTAEGQPYLPGVTDVTAFADRESPPTPEHVFASREDTVWAQLWPYRHDELGQRQRRVLHFDHETRDLEGRLLADQPVSRPTNDQQVNWTLKQSTTGTVPLCRALALDLWVKPRSLNAGRFLDVGGTSADIDRLSLMIDGPDLVLRVLDGTGDHPDTTFKEAGEIRYALARGTDPGLPVDVWSHVALAVRGNQPSQIDLRVNGRWHGVRRPGLTRLTANLDTSTGSIPVESTEGFPERCCVRIGNELIEVTVSSTGMVAAREETGRYAGFGGRTAREQFTSTDTTGEALYPGTDVPVNLGSITTTHPAGAPVELYGYSAPFASNVATGAAALTGGIGPWRVAKAVQFLGATTPQGDPIQLTFGLTTFTLGNGLETASNPTGILLVPADDPAQPPEEVMRAFHTGGGYAAIIQTTDTNGPRQTLAGSPLGGIEIIRYSGWSGSTLNVEARGISAAELPRMAQDPQGWLTNILDVAATDARRAFVASFTGAFTQYNPELYLSTFVVPISLAVPNASPTDFDPLLGPSHFAQITHLTDAENTEWVRYDDFIQQRGQLVRDEPKALRWLFNVLSLRQGPPNFQPPLPTPPGGGPTPPGGPMLEPDELVVGKLAPPAAEPAAQYSSNWEPRLGKSENENFPLSDAASSRFQFRGVFGTFTHTHPANVEILPAFQIRDLGASGGHPGRFDSAFLVGANSDHLGWPVIVHHVHRPSPENKFSYWQQVQGQTTATFAPAPTDPPDDSDAQETDLLPYIYVALQQKAPEPFVPQTAQTNPNQPLLDTREMARLVAYPSGELPRRVDRMALGGTFDARGGEVPDALIDEVIFGDTRTFHVPLGGSQPFQGAALVFDNGGGIAGIDDSELTLRVAPKAVRLAGVVYYLDYEFLTELPSDAGLLKIGDEVVCYNQRDPATGVFQLATNGRGLMGTVAQPHDVTEPVTFLEHVTVSFLASAVGATDSALPLASTDEFPTSGTVLIGEELIHYTRHAGGVLEMPRASSVPGRMDELGEGLFRGRFGSTAAAHAAGEAVILFPIRYWDRWAPRADASELAFFTLTNDQPSAFWSALFFQKEDTDAASLGVLVQLDPEAPWDADPESDPRLKLFWSGDENGKPWALGRQSDRLSARAFVRYAPGAFDGPTGLAHGWRQSPRLKLFGTAFFAPSLTLRSVER